MYATTTEARYAMIKGISSSPMICSIMTVKRKMGSPKPFRSSPPERV